MPTIISHSVFLGNSGPLLVPASCKVCGPIQARIDFPFPAPSEAEFIGTYATCPMCGGLATVENGVHSFFEQIVAITRRSNITKKDAKRFIKKVETAANLNAIPDAARAINEDLVEIAKLALAQSEPKSAFRQACYIIAQIIIVGANALLGAYHGQLLYEKNFGTTSSPSEEVETGPSGNEADPKPDQETDTAKGDLPKTKET